ncbi:MAG: hypothetical protein ABIP20_12210 [Chthoniobacteraceae bacterium]
MKRDDSSRRSKTEIATAATALGSIGTLVALSVTGILTALPLWLSVLIVLLELLAPALVFVVLKRKDGQG